MKDIFLFEEKITKWKALCIQLSYFGISLYCLFNFHLKILEYNHPLFFDFAFLGDVFNLHLSFRRKTDHAGIFFDITLFGLSFHINWYDIRHFDE